MDLGRRKISSRLAIDEKILLMFRRKPEYENLWNESGQHLERLHISSEEGENKKIKHVVIQTECFASMLGYIGSTV